MCYLVVSPVGVDVVRELRGHDGVALSTRAISAQHYTSLRTIEEQVTKQNLT